MIILLGMPKSGSSSFQELFTKLGYKSYHWKKGNHKYDGIWGRHWYDNVINTTGFQKYKGKDITIENEFDSIYNEAMEYYNYFKDIK